jgi:inositol transport system substrate-binding protein
MSAIKISLLAGAFGATLALPLSPARADNERIVAIFHNLAEPFFVFMGRELNVAAKEEKVRVSVSDGQASSPKETSDVENALAQGVDGIILAPTDVKALVPAVNEILDAKVPIVTVDRRVDGADKPVPLVGADNVKGGTMQAEWVVKNFPDGARVVYLSGAPGSSSGIDRAKGLHDAFAAAGGKYQIVAEQSANWARAQGLSVTDSVLTELSGKPPSVIIAANDDMALGAVEAVHSANLDKTGTKVIGFDATPDALAAIKAGRMSATLEQSPSKQIRTALHMLVDNIRKHTEMKSVAITPILITADNLKEAERFSEVK